MSEVAMHTYRDGSPSLGDDVTYSGPSDFYMNRSQEMRYVSLTIPNELINETIRALGKFGKFHIEDIVGQNVTKHHFVYKKRTTEIAEIEKKLKNFEDLMKKLGIYLPILDYTADLGTVGEATLKNNPDVVVGASEFVNEFETQLNPNLNFEKTIQAEIARRVELNAVLQHVPDLVPPGVYSESAEQAALNFDFGNSAQQDYDPEDGLSNYICGVIPLESQDIFARMVHRISRGANAIIKFSNPLPEPLVDPETGEKITKSVFCVVTIGSQLNRRIRKLCPLANATIYQVPSKTELIAQTTQRLDSEIRDQQNALNRTTQTIIELLEGLIAPYSEMGGGIGPCPLRLWQQFLFRERIIIDSLMKCEFHATLVYMAGWVPVSAIDDLARVVSESGVQGGAAPALDRRAPVPHGTKPPTYIEGNKFTSSFQGIVDTYGIPRYQEFNPGIFTIVSFPFLFGVMYGDIGHGTVIALVGFLFILFEGVFERMRKEGTMNEMVDMVYGGRYIIALMGLFGLYCGIIYNDFMSIPFNVYGSNYYIDAAVSTTERQWNGHVYPMGIDPGWYHGKNTLKFFNSLKMKTAVILGVTHMTFGLVLSLFNNIYFKDHVAIVFDFLPRFIFLLSTFGYMVFMIIYKWCIDWSGDTSKAPNLIQTMIDMYLSAGSVEEDSRLYANQEVVQSILAIITLVCIPWMLCFKPVIEYNKAKGGCKILACLNSPADEEYRRAHVLHSDDHNDLTLNSVTIHASSSSDDLSSHQEPAHTHEEHSFGDLMIHQGIHTIEFILGSVSNTASYLRLWALSLAHAQLADVFWTKMIFEYGITNSGFFGFLGTGVWVVATVGVILAMDSLECFLHALRLHWVEFQNKFYYADGRAFEPFNFIPKLD